VAKGRGTWASIILSFLHTIVFADTGNTCALGDILFVKAQRKTSMMVRSI
jgi:hypothetical protein